MHLGRTLMRFVLLMAVWLSLTMGTLFGQQGAALVPDTIFYNGKIITVDSAFSIQEAFAVKGWRLLGFGVLSALELR